MQSRFSRVNLLVRSFSIVTFYFVFSAGAAHAGDDYAILYFMPISGGGDCGPSGSSGGSSGSSNSDDCAGSGFSTGSLSASSPGEYLDAMEKTRDILEEHTTLIDGATFTSGGFIGAEHFNDGALTFSEGEYYLIDTDLVPDHGNNYAPPFGYARDFSIYAHWTLVRAWVEKAAETADHIVIVGQSFSGPAVVLAASTVHPTVAEKIDAVVTLAGPNAGIGLANACDLYAQAACDLQPDSDAMSLLLNLAEDAVASPTRRLGSKLISVSSEIRNEWGSPQGHDGLISSASQNFLFSNSWEQLRYKQGLTLDEPAYWAIFYDVVDWWDTELGSNHILVNHGPAMNNAIAFVDDHMVGSSGFCPQDQTCAEGDGDCDSNEECEAGLRCMSDVGPNYGWSWGTDVCEVNANGESDHCASESPCEEGEGDCDSHYECDAGLRCVSNVGPGYGWSWATDVCEVNVNGESDHCSSEFPCEEGEGDCDSQQDCGSGLRCVSNVGPNYGWSVNTDVCEINGNGASDHCSSEFPCGLNQGHCNSQSECLSGLTCMPSGIGQPNYCRY